MDRTQKDNKRRNQNNEELRENTGHTWREAFRFRAAVQTPTGEVRNTKIITQEIRNTTTVTMKDTLKSQHRMYETECELQLLFTIRYALFKIIEGEKFLFTPLDDALTSTSYCERDRRAIFSRRVSKSCSHCWLFHLCKLLLVSPQDGWFVLCGWCRSAGGSLFLFTAARHIWLSEAFLLCLYISKTRDELTCSYYLMCFFRGWHTDMSSSYVILSDDKA